MRSRKGSVAMAGGEAMPFANSHRHAELVSASIAPLTSMLKPQAAPAVCSLDPSAQSDGWTLKQVQGGDDLEVVR